MAQTPGSWCRPRVARRARLSVLARHHVASQHQDQYPLPTILTRTQVQRIGRFLSDRPRIVSGHDGFQASV